MDTTSADDATRAAARRVLRAKRARDADGKPVRSGGAGWVLLLIVAGLSFVGVAALMLWAGGALDVF